MFESKSGVLLIGGLGFFVFAFLSNALVPVLMYRHLPEADGRAAGRQEQQLDVPVRGPAAIAIPSRSPSTSASRRRRSAPRRCGWAGKIYVGEGCWHCHSQFVRPVSNEEDRWGPVSQTEEYQNELQRPVMFGTRRVGPDL